MANRRYIEDYFPVKEVGEASAKEKNIRRGHISTLHIWWARRPLAASRATAYAALTPSPKDAEDWQKKRDFIIELSKWENSNNRQFLNKARKEILEANGGIPPKVLDPFAGGGSYPLEAMRLGCESYANDYNPVAVLIEKATLEYPQKFGKPFKNMPDWVLPEDRVNLNTHKSRLSIRENGYQLSFDNKSSEGKERRQFNPLSNAVRHWGNWIFSEAQKELAEYYLPDHGGDTPIGYLWARTIECQNPSCKKDIPLMKTFWVSQKEKQKIAIFPRVRNGTLNFELVGEGFLPFPLNFNPDDGTISRAVANCPLCGNVIDEHTTRKLFREHKSSEKIMVVAYSGTHTSGIRYRLADEKDEEIFRLAKEELFRKRDVLKEDWGFDPIPDEELPLMSGVFNVPLYGINTWGELFNARQLLSLLCFADKIRLATRKIAQQNNDEFSKAVATYLAFTFDKLATYCCSLTRWRSDVTSFERIFDKQALPMIMDYGEVNPFSVRRGGWDFDSIIEAIENLSEITPVSPPVITQGSATQLSYEDNYFDAILTDPPYYNSVPYADLSDFFYVWLKRTLFDSYPELFSTPLSPKEKEITEMAGWDKQRYAYKDKQFFEDNLSKAFKEMYRMLKVDGISTIVYAHKSTSGWETIINALLDSGLVITGAWPINTELKTRMRASESAVLASSIYIVARKIPKQPSGFYNDIRIELRNHLDKKLQRLWGEGIGGADFFIAAIGSAIEVFGKYDQVIDFEGNVVRADRLLQEVRTIATDYAVRQILHNGFATEISDLSRLYVLWRWNYGEAIVPFDEARKLGQSCGIDVSLLWGKNGVIKKEKEFIRLLGPQNRKLEDLDDPRDLIDVLHKSLLLWEKGSKVEMIQTLSEKGYGKSEAFYRVAQAISETLPLESKEKKLLDGFLAGKERVQSEVEKIETQGRLFK